MSSPHPRKPLWACGVLPRCQRERGGCGCQRCEPPVPAPGCCGSCVCVCTRVHPRLRVQGGWRRPCVSGAAAAVGASRVQLHAQDGCSRGHRSCGEQCEWWQKAPGCSRARGEGDEGSWLPLLPPRGIRREEPQPRGAGEAAAPFSAAAAAPQVGSGRGSEGPVRWVSATRAERGGSHGCARVHLAQTGSPAVWICACRGHGQTGARVCVRTHVLALTCAPGHVCTRSHICAPAAARRRRRVRARAGRGGRTHMSGVALTCSRARFASPAASARRAAASRRCRGVTHGRPEEAVTQSWTPASPHPAAGRPSRPRGACGT